LYTCCFLRRKYTSEPADPVYRYHPLEDKELLEKFAQPESRNMAFNQLVRKYQEKIYWHIRKMVIDHDDADDLTQDVFLKVWKNLDNFRQDAQLYTWIYRIATNECLSFLSSKKRKFFLPLNDVTAELMEKVEASPELAGDEVQMKLQKAILRLPEKQRLVFNMKYFDEMKYEEMSEILGTSVGALKASYHIAVKKIEEFIKRD
jgi:RNA polymerase sigma factor (sigma-70 family)